MADYFSADLMEDFFEIFDDMSQDDVAPTTDVALVERVSFDSFVNISMDGEIDILQGNYSFVPLNSPLIIHYLRSRAAYCCGKTECPPSGTECTYSAI